MGFIVIGVQRWPAVPTLAAATPALAFGHAIGRIGCLLVGDDYGRPTDLPWGIAFPEGLPPTTVPVHPTQLYEAGLLVVPGWALTRWRRRGVSAGRVLGGRLFFAAATRFSIEFIRVNERVRGVEPNMESGRSSIHTLPGYGALFDPQTGGGLLIRVAPSQADRLLKHLASLGCRQASVIGEVISPARSRRRFARRVMPRGVQRPSASAAAAQRFGSGRSNSGRAATDDSD